MNGFIHGGIFLIATLMGGCATNLGTGMIAATSLGAGIGGITGGGGGSLIGGAAGVILGGAIGSHIDAQDRKVIQKTSPRTIERLDQKEPLTVNDIIKLSQASVKEELIIDYMYERQTIYHLSQAQVRRMQEAGVSQKVIDYMNTTQSRSDRME